MFSIGEFSLITRLPVKTLRYYHEEGILVPDYIDDDTGYRYYRESSAERAAVISLLKQLNFPIADIRSMLADKTDETDLAPFFIAQKQKLRTTIESYKKAEESINTILELIERTQMNTADISYKIEEKILDDIIFAGYRFKGKYDEVGSAFRLIARHAGRFIAGPSMSLYYECEYRENNADIEGGFAVSKTVSIPEANCRVLKGGKAVTIIHQGSFDTLGKSYEKIFLYLESNKLTPVYPSREIYLKGPGMIFKGNPEKYLTEIQILVQ